MKPQTIKQLSEKYKEKLTNTRTQIGILRKERDNRPDYWDLVLTVKIYRVFVNDLERLQNWEELETLLRK